MNATKSRDMKTYLVALPAFRGSKGFCHQTVLVSAKNEHDAVAAAYRIKGPHINIGEIKEVNY